MCVQRLNCLLPNFSLPPSSLFLLFPFSLLSSLLPSSRQADVNGLKWVRYMGPNSASLEAPKDDPVLNSYAKLVNEG